MFEDEFTQPGDGDPGNLPDTVEPSSGGEGAVARDGNVIEHPSAARNGKPIDEAPDPPEEDDGQTVFEVYAGRAQPEQPSMGALLKRGTPVELRVKMSGKSIPGAKGGLIDPYATSIPLIADCVIDDHDTQYIRDEAGRVEGAILYMTLKPRRVADLRTEQGRAWLREMGVLDEAVEAS
jgi:hypothetical protein